MPLLSIPSGNVASATASTAYSVANSCRFTSGASMEKAFGTPTNLDKWTFSCWLKRGNIGAYHEIFSGFTSGTHYTHIEITDGDKLEFGNRAGGGAGGHLGRLITNRLFRDVAAWYNIVCVWDSDNATAGNRMRVYINGVEETSFSTEVDATSGELCHLASGDDCVIGLHGTSYLLDGYLAEVVLIDGQALTPTSFGEFDSDSPTIWKPIDVSGLTFGNNGFYLDFEASANLGNDANGGTDLTETGLDATDQATDTPTNNFATLNPLDNYYAGATFSEGNCKIVTTSTTVYAFQTSTIAMTAGKWYWETKTTSTNYDNLWGISDRHATAASEELGEKATQWAFYQASGLLRNNNGTTSYGNSWDNSETLGVALDLDNSKLYFAIDNTWQDSGDPTSGATGTGAISITAVGSTLNGMYFAAGGTYATGSGILLHNFGGCPPFALSSAESDANGYGSFEFAPPSGYLAICTKNLGSDGG